MKILLIEPYYSGSHKQWADGFKNHSRNEIKVLSLKGQFWKWRMHGGAVTIASKFNKMRWVPDIILCTDMMDLTVFISLSRKKIKDIPIALYFHENQLSYPWKPDDRDVKHKRDMHYSFINFSSALAADKVLFNSEFHMNSFIKNLKRFLKSFPDNREIEKVKQIKNKSKVLYLGLNLKKFDQLEVKTNNKPTLLWNHRWEYDKNPGLFFNTLKKLKENNIDFELVVVGENFNRAPSIFDEARKIFNDNIIHWGYAKTFDEYADNLWKSNILPVTSIQDFFGISIMEAIYCNNLPILPYRLSYKELVPKRFKELVFYENDQSFYQKVCWAINNYSKIELSPLKTNAKRFDWNIMAPIYDDFFYDLI